MKKCLKILCVIAISFSFSGVAAAQEAGRQFDITVVLDDEKKITWPAPANIINEAVEHAMPSPIFFRNSHENLNNYLTSFNKPKSSDFDKNLEFYEVLARSLNTYIKPSLTYIKAQDAVWEEKNGRVVDFFAGLNGLSYDLRRIIADMHFTLKRQEKEMRVSALTTVPHHKLEDINPYGISELIATGSSDFAGSSQNRITNIKVSSERYRGLLIPPNDIFSFNQFLGSVDAEHGFTPELVIKNNELVPEFGGGICQVSTTMFRTALNGGLPIPERRNHSFAVSYYEPQGTDATIYPGVQDLKFINDTNSHILIWYQISGTRHTFNFYGRSDQRSVEISAPVRYDITDKGAFRTSLARKVVYADGRTEEDVFRSSYRPPQEFTQTTTEQDPVPNTEPEEELND